MSPEFLEVWFFSPTVVANLNMSLTFWLQIDFSCFIWFVWITLGIVNRIQQVTQCLDLWFTFRN